MTEDRTKYLVAMAILTKNVKNTIKRVKTHTDATLLVRFERISRKARIVANADNIISIFQKIEKFKVVMQPLLIH